MLNLPSKRDWMMIGGMLLALAVWAGVSTADAQDAENSRREYCEMVAAWDADAAMDVAPEQRRGWPPFDGRCENNQKDTEG